MKRIRPERIRELHERRDLPGPPEGLTYEQAIDDPLTLPFETRRKVATEAMMLGLIDGWQALGFMLYGVAEIDYEPEAIDENGDWIIGEDCGDFDQSVTFDSLMDLSRV